ncbi:MAG: hypothetical protein WCK29_02765 [archaeon]
MKMKRGLSIYATFIVLTSFLLPNVFAYFDTSNPQGMIQSVIQGMTDIATPVFSSLFGTYYSDDFLFVKILLFLLLFVVIKQAVKSFPKFGEQNMVVNIISFVVAVLAVRFMPDTTIMHDLFLPYSTLGIAILTIIPFLIWFYFVEKSMSSAVGRKIAWLLFTVVMVVLWISRSGQMSDIGNYIYLAIVLLAILLLLFDRHVRRYFDLQNDRKVAKNTLERSLVREQALYQEIINVDSPAADHQRKQIIKRIKKLEDEIHRL